MGRPNQKRDNIPLLLTVILFMFTIMFSICGYAYTQDMGYLRESITQIRVGQEKAHVENKEKYENLETRVRKLEIKNGE